MRACALVCVTAALALAAGPGKEAKSRRVARLVEQLGDDDFDKREAASKELERVGEPAVDALRKAASAADLEVRRRARALLVKAGWVPLFNGKDLGGWKVYPGGTGNWKVEEGALTCRGGTSHLFSERGDYQDFHLRVEARINDGGNSGQYFRTRFGPGHPAGYEAQISATLGEPVPTGSLYPDSPDLRLAKGLVLREAPHKPDEWFTQEVIAVGDRITILVNGKKTVDWRDPKWRYKKGHFALQHHNPHTAVKFRAVEVKELPAGRPKK
jgi:hypothetical protein